MEMILLAPVHGVTWFIVVLHSLTTNLYGASPACHEAVVPIGYHGLAYTMHVEQSTLQYHLIELHILDTYSGKQLLKAVTDV
jgi:hypothetical protein